MKASSRSSATAKPRRKTASAGPVQARPPRKTAGAPRKPSGKDDPDTWILRLYVAGQTPRSLAAFANLTRLCEHHLAGRYAIEVIDLVKQPQLAQGDQILAIPTLVRKLPQPIKRVIGDLSNLERVLVGMDLKPPPRENAAS